MLKPFVPEILPLENINWENLLTNIVRANSAVAKFDGLLESIPNPLLFLNPHAAKVIKNLLENQIIDIVTPAQGRRPAMYSFKPLMEIVK